MQRIAITLLCAMTIPFTCLAQNVPSTDSSTAAQTQSDAGGNTCVLQQAEPALPLSTRGRYIVDRTGRRFKLNGVAWSGAESTDFIVGGLQLEPLAAIVRRIRCMGFNTVRLPWSNEMYESNPRVPDYAVTANPQLKGMHALQVYSIVVRELARQGILVVLDNHNSNAEWCCGDDGNDLWYNAQYPESSWIADWKGLAQRFKDVPQVIGADLRNEPRINATWGGAPTTDWHAAAQRGGNAVLSVNPNLLQIVEGVSYALDLTGVANLPVQFNVPNKLVYSAHDYPFDHNGLTNAAALESALNQAWGYILTPKQNYTAPVWLGEFGNCHTASTCITDTTSSSGSGGLWFSSIRQYLAKYDLDWSYWELNGTESSGVSRIFGSEETYGVLNPYWNAPAIPNELNPLPTLNTLDALQTVIGPNQGPGLLPSYPPVVAMTMPLPGSTAASGMAVALSADASLTAGSSTSISNVDYYANGRMVATASTAPYMAVWQKAAPGRYTLQAEAVTSAGLKTRSGRVPFEAINYVSHQPTYSSSIAINFVSYAVTPMAPTEIAGAVPQANWNQATGAVNSGQLTALVDQSGTPTTAIIDWSAPNTYFTAIPDQLGNDRMMKGYLDNSNTAPNMLQVTGLPTSFKRYDVIVYFDGGNESSNGIVGPSRAANFRLTAVDNYGVHGCAGQTREGSTVTGLDAGGVDFSGMFIQAYGGSPGNYVKFVDCTGSNFSVAPVHGASTDNQVRAPVNGVQILAYAK